MSVLTRVMSWLQPTPQRTPDLDRALRQRQEADVLLRQLRAELKLMERWKDATRRDRP